MSNIYIEAGMKQVCFAANNHLQKPLLLPTVGSNDGYTMKVLQNSRHPSGFWQLTRLSIKD